jgi:two-component system KDP operon response regulator KdpE
MRNKKILIVDDDADIRLGYEVLLTANHYDTFFASDALSTVIDAHTHKPDLIILDLGLPAVPRSEYTLPLPQPGGGFLVMERLAADTDLALIPVIIVSGLDPYANWERALRGGAMAFVQKPWDQDKLLAIIGQLLGSAELSISQPNPRTVQREGMQEALEALPQWRRTGGPPHES